MLSLISVVLLRNFYLSCYERWQPVRNGTKNTEQTIKLIYWLYWVQKRKIKNYCVTCNEAEREIAFWRLAKKWGWYFNGNNFKDSIWTSQNCLTSLLKKKFQKSTMHKEFFRMPNFLILDFFLLPLLFLKILSMMIHPLHLITLRNIVVLFLEKLRRWVTNTRMVDFPCTHTDEEN